jgi:hypothetical protein
LLAPADATGAYKATTNIAVLSYFPAYVDTPLPRTFDEGRSHFHETRPSDIPPTGMRDRRQYRNIALHGLTALAILV